MWDSLARGELSGKQAIGKGRMDALEKVVRSRVDVPEALIMRDDMYIPWEYLADLVSGSDMAYKNEVLEILRGEHKIVPYNGRQQIDSRIPALKNSVTARCGTNSISVFPPYA